MKKIIFSICTVFLFLVQANAAVKAIDNYELSKFMKKRMVVVDIRDKSYWDDTGIIPSSYKITYKNHQNLKNWLRVFTRIVKSKSTSFVLISKNGKKARKLSKLLDQKVGYQKIYYLKGGIDSWINDDGRVVKY